MSRLVITLKRGRDGATAMRELRAAGVECRPVRGLRRHFIVENADAALVAKLRSDPAFDSVEDGDKAYPPPADQAISCDVLMEGGNWALPRIVRRVAPWNVDWIRHPINTFYREPVRDGTGVDVYMLDTGVSVAHDEFGGRVSTVWEFASSGGLGDDNGHGTSVASLCFGETCGTARGATAFSFKCSTSAAGGTTAAAFVEGVGEILTHYAARAGLDRPAVLQASINPLLGATAAAAVEDLVDEGMVCVLAGGNDSAELTVEVYPLGFADGAIVVGAMAAADIPATFTNHGARIHIMSPGSSIWAAAAPVLSVGDFRSFGGTSGACPVVSGVVACMLQGHPRFTTRAEVEAVNAKLLANASTGFRTAFGKTLPDKMLYLDPAATFEDFV